MSTNVFEKCLDLWIFLFCYHKKFWAQPLVGAWHLGRADTVLWAMVAYIWLQNKLVPPLGKWCIFVSTVVSATELRPPHICIQVPWIWSRRENRAWFGCQYFTGPFKGRPWMEEPEWIQCGLIRLTRGPCWLVFPNERHRESSISRPKKFIVAFITCIQLQRWDLL